MRIKKIVGELLLLFGIIKIKKPPEEPVGFQQVRNGKIGSFEHREFLDDRFGKHGADQGIRDESRKRFAKEYRARYPRAMLADGSGRQQGKIFERLRPAFRKKGVMGNDYIFPVPHRLLEAIRKHGKKYPLERIVREVGSLRAISHESVCFERLVGSNGYPVYMFEMGEIEEIRHREPCRNGIFPIVNRYLIPFGKIQPDSGFFENISYRVGTVGIFVPPDDAEVLFGLSWPGLQKGIRVRKPQAVKRANHAVAMRLSLGEIGSEVRAESGHDPQAAGFSPNDQQRGVSDFRGCQSVAADARSYRVPLVGPNAIPNGNRFSVFYGHRFGTGFIFLLPGAYRE